jgi:hypothetical protein
MFRLSQLCTPPSTQTPESFKRRSACAARSNVLERSAAQHGAGKALRHQRRGCAVLRRSAAGALGTSDRASRAAVQVPLGRLALASFGNPFFFDLLCGSRCESTPKPSRQWRREWRRAGRVSGVEVWAGPPPPLLYYFPLVPAPESTRSSTTMSDRPRTASSPRPTPRSSASASPRLSPRLSNRRPEGR